MPRTWDRKQPINDKDPLRNDLDYDNPGGIIAQGAEQAGNPVHEFFKGVGGLFNLPTPQEFFEGVKDGASALWDVATEIFIKPLGKFANLIGGLLDPSKIPILDPTKVLNLPGLLSGFQGVLNGMVRGWKRVPDAIGSVDDVELIFGEARQVQFGLITLADLAKAPDNAPLWLSPNPFEDVSFPRRLLRPVQSVDGLTATMDASGTTLPLSGSWSGTIAGLLNNHRHNVAVSNSRPRFTIPSGTLALSAHRLTKDRIVNMVRFMAGGDTPTGQILVGLYSIDPLTGDMTRVYDFGDVAGEVDTGPLIYECSLEMSSDMLADAGSLYAVGILPLGGPFAVGAITRQRSIPDPVIYPQGVTELLAGQTFLPATIVETALNHDASHSIWTGIGQTVPTTITPVTGIVDFDAYSDNQNWSSPALKNFRNNSSARWSIVDGMLIPNGPPQIAPIDYRLAYLTLQRCATSNMFSEFVVGSGWTSAITAADRCFVNCNAEGTEGVMMEVAQDGSDPATVTIETITDMVNGGTVRATNSGVVYANPTDLFRVEAVHDEDTGYTTYTGYLNGEPIPGVEWEDTTGIVDVGTAWRRCGYGATAASFSNVLYRAAAAEVWRFGDLALAA